MSRDRVSQELRTIEAKIDGFHLSNPLLRLPFAPAAWYFLAVCEDMCLFDVLRDAGETRITAADSAAFSDHILVHSTWPLRWLNRGCEAGGRISTDYDDENYEAATLLSQLSARYLNFESAFSYATWGLATLTLDGYRIRTSGPIRQDVRYEAYDRLVQDLPSLDLEPEVGAFHSLLVGSMRVMKNTFAYDLNPRFVGAAIEFTGPVVEARFNLPPAWKMPRYDFADFRKVAKVIWALAFTHYQARVFAAMAGCVGGGYSNAVLLMEGPELLNRVRRYSGVKESRVSAIISDLTYGAHDQINSDPALQPLIKLNSNTFAIPPSIVLNSSMERNFSVLLNRLPEEQKAYSALSQQRESLSRERIARELTGMRLRLWHGEISEWGAARDVDLAIISDEQQACLILELKSFIAPADPREIRERSEEIAKGIRQVQSRREMIAQNPEALFQCAGISRAFQIYCAVASESSIGANYVQVVDVAVVNTTHLLTKLKNVGDLRGIFIWLDRKEYLPVEGIHFKKADTEDTIGPWTLDWYGLSDLVENYRTAV